MNSQVPTIDFEHFERFVYGSIKDREQTAIEIDKSLKTLGFFYLGNHGVDQRKIDASFEWSRQFFNLSEHQKELLGPPPARSFDQGYFGIGKEKIRGQTSLNESFDFGNPQDNTQWRDSESQYYCSKADIRNDPGTWGRRCFQHP